MPVRPAMGRLSAGGGMTVDFGGKAASGLSPLYAGGLLLLVAGLASIPGYLVFEVWASVETMKREWAIVGPPCPEVETPAANVLGKKPLKVFTYGGVRFERKTGHVDCAALPEPALPWETPVTYRVCQFTGPGLVGVASGGRHVWYQPGFGKPVTVTVRHGRTSCVTAGWFRG